MIYIWFLLTIPHDRVICELWTRNYPAPTALVQACGTNDLSKYRLDVLQGGVGECSIPAASLFWVLEDCQLNGTLDQYRLRIVEPNYQEAIGCTVTTITQARPTDYEAHKQCPRATEYELRYSGARQPDPVAGSCKPPSVTQPATLATAETYHLLAGKLIWYGLARAQCPAGYAGVDPKTFAATPCGMDGARPQMLAWQNSLDESILAAAREWNVPADLLKRILAKESQFWVWTGVDGEHGLAQITDDGAALVMHMYLKGYYQLTPYQQAQARAAWLNTFDCPHCTPNETMQHARETMPKVAQALAAYYCTFGSWDAAITKWNIKHNLTTSP